MIELREITKSYGQKNILNRVNLIVPFGAVTALSGPSGSGKTTLARILLLLEHPDQGRVEGVGGLRLAAVFQEDRLIEHMSAAENLTLAGASEAAARVHLESLGLEADVRTRVSRLSGGMRRRVALARAMIVGADLIVLDEPMTGLDEKAKTVAAAYVMAQKKNAAVLVITHDEEERRLLKADQNFFLTLPGERATEQALSASKNR